MAVSKEFFDLDDYVPFFLTAISNKISRSASRLYLRKFGVGIVEWRLLCAFAVFDESTARACCDLIGLDKAAVSRAFKSMEADGLIVEVEGTFPGRNKPFKLTDAGEKLFYDVATVALEREKRLTSCLSSDERNQFLDYMKRIHAHMDSFVKADNEV